MTRHQIAAELHDLAHTLRTHQGSDHMDKDTRSNINRALAKAIAYRDCGKTADMEIWAAKLAVLLGAASILTTNALIDAASEEN